MAEFESRIQRVRAALAEQHLDAVLITHPSNRFYLTGFTGEDIAPNESSGHLIVTATSASLVTGSVNVTQAEHQSPHVQVIRREGGWAKADAAVLKEAQATRVGYEADALLVSVYHGVAEEVRGDTRDIEWVAVDGLVERIRAAKSPAEVELIRKAFEITNAVFDEVAPTIRAGQTEREIAWKIHMSMVEKGAEGPAFPTIVAAGTHAARPHHEPGDRVIAEGEPIVIDMGARYHGYCADLTRTVCVGEPDEKLREVYPIVAQAVEEVLERVGAGVPGKRMDEAARSFIDSKGYGEAFSHGLGHGVGVRVHESPFIHKESEDILAVGNVVTIEPGVYLPEWGGVRVEDVILITENGIELLTTATKMTIDDQAPRLTGFTPTERGTA